MTKLVVTCRDFYNVAYKHIHEFVQSVIYDRGYSSAKSKELATSTAHDIAMVVIIGSTYLEATSSVTSSDISTIASDIEDYLEDELSPPINGFADELHSINTLLHAIIETDEFAEFWKRYSRVKRRAQRKHAIENVSVNPKTMIVLIEVENG